MIQESTPARPVAADDDLHWRRIGAWAGLAFVVLGVLSTFFYPQPPRIDSSPAVMLRWAHHHRGGIDAGMIMGVLAALPFVWFAVTMKQRLEERGGRFLGSAAFGAGVAYAVYVGLASLPAATLVYMDGQPGSITDGDIVRLMMDWYMILYAPAMGLLGVFLLTAGLAGLRAGAFTRATSCIAAGMGVLCAVETVPIMVNSSYHPGGWAVFGWGTTIGSLLVVALLAVELLRSARPAPA
ncbi:MAG TPA: hypothetical protein VKI19_09720 [Acidimicrobiales bacterium]|nr:hypothetical protein [Acidimicrobiales bacterium]